MTERSLKFMHGLGDVSNFGRMIPLYKKYGINLNIECTEDKQLIFKCTDTNIITGANETHSWWSATQPVTTNNSWSGNKCGENLRHYGLQEGGAKIPTMEDLWEEYKAVDLQCRHLIPDQSFEEIDKVIQDWPRPLILWHSMGNTNQSIKSFSASEQDKFLYQLIDQTDGTIILLDWDNRVSWTKNHRIKHLVQEFGHIGLGRLAALMYRSQLMIGVDSGPFYFSAYTNIPSVGIYFNGLHPCEYMVPCKRALTFALGGKSSRFDPSKRFEFQIISASDDMSYISKWVSKMVKGHRYFAADVPIAADVQLQQIVQEKCRGNGVSGGISSIYDRHRSFDLLLSECRHRFTYPKFVETGCIRSDEDWGGAGFSTALFGRYCNVSGGQLHSFDLSEDNVNYARQWCKQFGESVVVRCCTGEEGIRSFNDLIDVLYLDSLDTGCEGHQQCNLAEFKAAESKLHDRSIVVIDDTPSLTDGKGGLTVNYMLQNGWKMLYAGYQVVLSKTQFRY